MARPKTYHVDETGILRAIHRETVDRRRELQAEIDQLPKGRNHWDFQHLARAKTEAEWVRYEAELLVEGPVSDGLRRAILRTVLDLEKRGLIKGGGDRLTWIKLTDAGIEHLDHLEKKQAAE